METAIVECPACGRKLRAPSDRRVRLRCTPSQGGCGYDWIWEPGQTGETTRVAFRCAKTDGRFEVKLSRTRTTHKFRITAITTPAIKAASASVETGEARMSLPDRTLVQRIGMSFGGEHSSRPAIVADDPVKSESKIITKNYKADDFDWSGWQCPHCKHGKDTKSKFVQCHACNELVCGHNIIKINGGGETFKCSPSCGSSGELAGQIAGYSGSSVTVSKPTGPLLTGKPPPLRLK